jgi:general secretion pathway protein K
MVTRLQKSERGVALLAVLLGIALMTLIVVDFAMTSGLGFVSAANQANELRATYLARSGINVGLGLLAADARQDAQTLATTPGSGAIDTLNDVWAVPFPPMPLEGGTVSLSIVDEERKINLNGMVFNGQLNQAAILRVQRLFTILDVNVDLVQAIVDWITPGGGANGGGADFYMGLKPPYQPRFAAMPTIGDLQMIKGFNEAIFNRVAPFVTVMPVVAINANTAPPQVLASLEPELMEDQKIVQQIVEQRAIRPFSTPTEITDLVGAGDLATRVSHDVQLKSQFFTINGTGTYAGARKIITATFHRETNGIGTLASWRED